MRPSRLIGIALGVVLVTGCVKSPTASVELRRAMPAAAFDEAPPPPPPNASGGNLMGSGT